MLIAPVPLLVSSVPAKYTPKAFEVVPLPVPIKVMLLPATEPVVEIVPPFITKPSSLPVPLAPVPVIEIAPFTDVILLVE